MSYNGKSHVLLEPHNSIIYYWVESTEKKWEEGKADTEDNSYRMSKIAWLDPPNIVKNELNFDDVSLDINDRAYQAGVGFFTAFSLKEKKDSKKLIQELASVTPLIPRFTNQQKFKFSVIELMYENFQNQDIRSA